MRRQDIIRPPNLKQIILVLILLSIVVQTKAFTYEGTLTFQKDLFTRIDACGLRIKKLRKAHEYEPKEPNFHSLLLGG